MWIGAADVSRRTEMGPPLRQAPCTPSSIAAALITGDVGQLAMTQVTRFGVPRSRFELSAAFWSHSDVAFDGKSLLMLTRAGQVQIAAQINPVVNWSRS